ncbi:hypothetical protein TIFTF001_045472 [Ficus carica]|uniref:Uncharacterized protein n=1 Tax=Ficus carica TaxID=3494 RepID=A0AA87Z413_FICCA|nr:hypothetical protein TIFTF001_045471 [Ficus carica]GMN21271.1 hypothetical protein TIFTF001_045472 [Ficus carica]
MVLAFLSLEEALRNVVAKTWFLCLVNLYR